jgi:tRNA (adenine-N(1)-)-methyltransferase non-catalytic subunit
MSSSKRQLAPPKSNDVVESHTQSWSPEKRARLAGYLETQRLDYEPLVKEKDHAILSMGKGDSFTTIRSGGEMRMRGIKANVDPIIGQPFHSTFMIDKGVMKRREGGPMKASDIFEHLEDKDTDATFLPAANNALLVDDSANQTITPEEITAMKAKGMSGDEIIRAVAAKSKTFDSKTEYSQEKWLRKKQAKYSTDVQVVLPTPQAIIATLLEREPRKILGLRDDTLAQLLTTANVGAGSVTLVFDGAAGLVAGAVAARQGATGAVLALHTSQHGSFPIVADMNLPADSVATVLPLPSHLLGQIAPVNRGKAGAPFKSELAAVEPLFEEDVAAAEAAAAAAEVEAVAAAAVGAATGPRETPLKRLNRRAVGYLTRGAHALIVATGFQPLEATMPLLPYLLPSSPFVVYCQFLEPLARLQNHLLSLRMATNVTVTETWYRPQQILPNRTHPEMSMNATGGFLLHGTTISMDS